MKVKRKSTIQRIYMPGLRRAKDGSSFKIVNEQERQNERERAYKLVVLSRQRDQSLLKDIQDA